MQLIVHITVAPSSLKFRLIGHVLSPGYWLNFSEYYSSLISRRFWYYHLVCFSIEVIYWDIEVDVSLSNFALLVSCRAIHISYCPGLIFQFTCVRHACIWFMSFVFGKLSNHMIILEQTSSCVSQVSSSGVMLHNFNVSVVCCRGPCSNHM